MSNVEIDCENMVNETERLYQVTWIILNSVKTMKVGKFKLADFLKGSKSKDIASLSSQQGYGGLLWYDISTIVGFIGQLEEMELIKRKVIRDYYSELELSHAGKKVLDEKIKIELQIIKKEKPLTVGGTEKTTFELFKQGKAIEDIAQERNLATTTIYDHLYRLVANDYLSSSEFVQESVVDQILEAKRKFPNSVKLKEIKEILTEEISYNQIKCVLADKNLAKSSEIEDVNEEDEFWSEGYFAESISPEDMKEKMKTFHMKHDEEMNFNCANCDKNISAHNKDWHDGMCDDCHNKKYFPDD